MMKKINLLLCITICFSLHVDAKRASLNKRAKRFITRSAQKTRKAIDSHSGKLLATMFGLTMVQTGALGLGWLFWKRYSKKEDDFKTFLINKFTQEAGLTENSLDVSVTNKCCVSIVNRSGKKGNTINDSMLQELYAKWQKWWRIGQKLPELDSDIDNIEFGNPTSVDREVVSQRPSMVNVSAPPQPMQIPSDFNQVVSKPDSSTDDQNQSKVMKEQKKRTEENREIANKAGLS